MVLIRTLSGFLGLPSDWDFLPWPHSPDSGDVLLGYSMGGRLALQFLEAQWRTGIPARPPGDRHRFSKAIIVSAGLNAPDEARRARDEEWASRFESEEWLSLVLAWNSQPVFGGHALPRRETDYDRAELARQLRECSPAVLPPPRLESIETPLLWIAGERDEKYVDIARGAVARLPHAELWICPNAGHRVPWEQPDAFIERIGEFLGR